MHLTSKPASRVSSCRAWLQLERDRSDMNALMTCVVVTGRPQGHECSGYQGGVRGTEPPPRGEAHVSTQPSVHRIALRDHTGMYVHMCVCAHLCDVTI